jgi:2-polyprenyl-3-methyl-5-hydroxy-6-metoxy-1,4-benzoquinol methylase
MRYIFYIMNFLDILTKYSNPDVGSGTDKNTTHSYGELYNMILSGLETKENVSILEIGILSGAFLKVVAEFLPHASIYGIDITLDNIKYDLNTPQFHIYKMDGTLRSSAEKLNQSYDIIIEDGSHTPEDQVKTLDAFAPYIKPGGMYIIEDISEQGFQELHSKLSMIAKSYGLIMECYDLRNTKNRFDDIVAVFKRPINICS